MNKYEYRSIFADHIRRFMKMKNQMGIKAKGCAQTLKELDDICVYEKIKEPIITKSLVMKWKSSRVNDSDRTLYDKVINVGQFAKYMCHIGCSCYIPHMKNPSKTFIPYIFSNEQINNIFQKVDSMEIPLNDMKYKLFAMPALFRLLYGTGLRVGEAIALKKSDVDFKNNLILITKSKNNQQRIVPMNSSLRDVLMQYYEARNKLPLLGIHDKDDYFFISPSGVKIKLDNVYGWFKKVLKLCKIPHIGKHQGPRVHDLRHTFAVHSLKAQVESGADIYCVLPILSTFLGHKAFKGTEQYVRLTQMMFPDIIKMEDPISVFIFPSI